jgi:uncharacterized protein
VQIKAVIDTSVFIAGMLTSNPASSSAQVISTWRSGAFTLVMTPQCLTEAVAKMIDKGIAEEMIVDFVALIGQIALTIPGVYESYTLDSIDPSDNKFLAAAHESHADFLVSLDAKHILPLKHYHGTQIVTPELFLRNLMEGSAEATEEELDPEEKYQQEMIELRRELGP